MEDYKENIVKEYKNYFNDVNVNNGAVFDGSIKNINKLIKQKSSSYIPPLATAIIGTNNTAAYLPPEDCLNYWTDLDAQEQYLNTKPTNYLILNKPGVGAYILGEALSNKLKCVHLCPYNVIRDEVEQNSSTGKCIDFNMRHNKVISCHNILDIIKQKINSPSIGHRGYIISGFPLITTNDSSKYFVDNLHSEDSMTLSGEILEELLCKAVEKKPRKTKIRVGASKSSVSSIEDEMVEEEHETEAIIEEEEEVDNHPIEMPKFVLEPVSGIIATRKPYIDTVKAILLNQLNQLFHMSNNPDLVIYLSCPDLDVITKKWHKFYNYKDNTYKYLPFICDNTSNIRWPEKYVSYPAAINSININQYISTSKYDCHLPCNFKTSTTAQLCHYQQHILPVIHHQIQNYNPKYVIKLDGHISIDDLINEVSARLQSISIKPIVLPQPYFLNNDTEMSESAEDFWKSIEEAGVVTNNITFSKCPSLWFNRCPVELKRGRTVQGNLKYAVSFFKHLYLLFSYESMISFCINPRPYVKLQYLQPTCRIIVLGTKSSGKTMVCECLSWIFDAKILSYKRILEEQKKIKYEKFVESVWSEIIGPVEEKRNDIWTDLENERQKRLDEWLNNTLDDLQTYINLFYIYNTSDNQDSVALEMEDTKNILMDIPVLDDIDKCETLASNKSELIPYAPQAFLKITEKSTPCISDSDVTEAISAYIIANELQAGIEPTAEELVNEFIRLVTLIDDKIKQSSNLEQSYGKWIVDDFPSTSEIWSLLHETNMLPDYTISLLENREITPDLIQLYKNLERVQKDYLKTFQYVDDPLIHITLLKKPIKPKDSKYYITNLLEDIVYNSLYTETIENIDEEITRFNESVESYRLSIDDIRIKTEEKMKILIEVELQDKTEVTILEEILLKMRQAYNLPSIQNEDADFDDKDEEENNDLDYERYNDRRFLGDTNIYCPVAFYDYNVLWEGKSELTSEHNKKIYSFCKEECLTDFQQDPTKYQSWNLPNKHLPPLRICIVGCIGSGKTTLSQHIAKELGLLHIDFSEIINELFMPRHFKKVGRRYENPFIDMPFDEGIVTDVQIDEETVKNEVDIVSNEMELRSTVYNYLERGTPLPAILLQKLLKKIWLEEPYSRTGFVLDGFPRLNTDAEAMVTCFCVPNIVIELESNAELSVNRLAPSMFKSWKMHYMEAKRNVKNKFEIKRNEWLKYITRKIVIDLTIDQILEEVIPGDDNDNVNEMEPAGSMVIDAGQTESFNIDKKLHRLYQELIEQNPEPVDTSEWENPNEVFERMESRLESIYESDDENMQNMKELLTEQNIKIITLDGVKLIQKVFKNALLELSLYRNRNESFFEQTFIVTKEAAETLLANGFIMFSIFNRMCPVYIYENPSAIHNPCKIKENDSKVFYVVHRCFLYYVYSRDNLAKFRTNPIIYISSKNIYEYSEFPLRIGIIGPSKSGKSTLSKKLAKNFGVIPITKGMAVRYILENMCWTELAKDITKILNSGEILRLNLIVKAIQTVAMNHRTLSHGFVLDGFPANSAEYMELTSIGLDPLIIFHLKCDEKKLLDNTKEEMYYNILKRYPPYSVPFIENRLLNWHEDHVQNCINNDMLNVYIINSNKSKWECWDECRKVIPDFANKLHVYLLGLKNTDKAVDAGVLCISKSNFQKRMSQYKNFCPVCLQKNIIRHNGWPANHKGVIQYRNTFYWACQEHINFLLMNPTCLLSRDVVQIPEIPAVISKLNKSNIHENGICIVTYAESLPSKKFERGLGKYAVAYHGKHYLFCSIECLKKFMERPYLYHDITIFNQPTELPKIKLEQLPHIGYLEQSLANIITDACCYANMRRPKYPGLSVDLSALIYIGLYLKTHNSAMKPPILSFYIKAYNVYEARCKLILDLGLKLRSINNPLTTYPICCADSNYSNSSDTDTVCKPPSVKHSQNSSVISSD